MNVRIQHNDIIVGKITPKSETELDPEERLLRAISKIANELEIVLE